MAITNLDDLELSGQLKASKVKTTIDGGVAVKFINATGADSVKGTVLEASGSTDNAVQLVDIDDVDAMGIMLESGVANGSEVWVVITGIADVLYSSAVTRGTFSRVAVSADDTATEGYAVSEALPTSPFATDKHFAEIGHPIESIASAGLAKTVIHFN